MSRAVRRRRPIIVSTCAASREGKAISSASRRARRGAERAPRRCSGLPKCLAGRTGGPEGAARASPSGQECPHCRRNCHYDGDYLEVTESLSGEACQGVVEIGFGIADWHQHRDRRRHAISVTDFGQFSQGPRFHATATEPGLIARSCDRASFVPSGGSDLIVALLPRTIPTWCFAFSRNISIEGPGPRIRCPSCCVVHGRGPAWRPACEAGEESGSTGRQPHSGSPSAVRHHRHRPLWHRLCRPAPFDLGISCFMKPISRPTGKASKPVEASRRKASHPGWPRLSSAPARCPSCSRPSA